MEPSKSELRQQFKALRNAVENKQEQALLVKEHFFREIALQPSDIVSFYWPHKNEISIIPILEDVLEQRIRCAFPVVEEGQRILRFVLWKPGESLRENKYKIKEPAIMDAGQYVEPDIVIAPFLAFDSHGQRLGYGGGYYDATLEDLRSRKKITALGLAFQEQFSKTGLPYEEHDQPLDLVITPEKVYRF